ncbi:ABC transporter substrate-binding protein [Elioraea sp.]|uniref:ABC transporter substrate-binding protein n=1 Tax=Elioraea sp. TaxID=2185103 RepID=UPI0021DF2002|nr:ABC transporter substrate-binding protein [Elioraea sp.]GIX11047.1 MAG: ABC transporter substrate-binding protein [Elioraea sp.]
MKRLLLAAAAISVLAISSVSAQTMRIGLREDPDILDPTLARTYVGRIVFASLCDKLFDIDKDLNIVPQLATGFTWDDGRTLTITLREGVKFHDGETMDANAVAYSLNRHLTMQGSFRRGEINAMDRVEVVDPKTVRIHLKVPFAPFLAQLTDRAGMVLSPKAAEAAGRDFGLRPVCAGPFRFVERIAQDRIVVERFPDYWDKGNVHLDRIIYLPIPDSTVRLANLQSGALELTETISATDIPAVQRNPRLRVAMGDELGYQGITFNIANGDRARTPIGQHAKVRQAFDLAIDRATIIQVVYDGHFTPTAQAVPPSSPYHVRSLTPPTRDVARARALLREAGVATPVKVELTVPNNPDMRQVGEVIQAMAAEAGFEVSIRAMEFASSLQAAQRGDFEAYLVGWSGRTDPDGNLWTFVHSRGAQNDGKYANAEVDRLLDASREESDPEKRVAIFERMYRHYITEDRARLYLWHRKNIHAYSTRVQGFVPVPDGLIRVKGVRLAAN